jgi:hypothetical protein
VDTGVAQGWVPAEYLSKKRPGAAGAGAGAGAVASVYTSKLINPMMEESSFETSSGLPSAAGRGSGPGSWAHCTLIDPSTTIC